MVATRGPQPRAARLLAWLPPLLFAAGLAVLRVTGRPEVHDSPIILLALNAIFATFVGFFVAFLCARSFLVTAEPGVLLLGCGALAWGVATGIAALSLWRGSNFSVTIHNLGAWIFGVCSLAGAALASQTRWRVRTPGTWLTTVYGVGLVAVVLVTAATLEGWTPVFFVQGQGGTPVLEVILWWAIAMFGVTAAVLWGLNRRAPSAFLQWYAPGLALLAIGLGGVGLETTLGGLHSWTSRAAQYLGGVYLLVAGVAAVRDAHGWRISLAEALRASQERYAAFASATFEGIVESEAGRIVACNEQFAQMAGRSVAELAGMAVIDLVVPADRERVSANVVGNIESVIEHGMLRNDGTSLVVEAHGRPVAPRATHRFTAVRDITERKRTETDLVRTAAQRQLALDAARMGWWHYDPLTRMAEWDDRYKEIFGVTGYERANDEILAEIIHPDDLPALWSKVEAALDPADPRPYAAEYRINRPDGTMRWIEAHGVASFDGHGENCRAVSFVGTVADITDRKRSQERVDRLAKLYAVLSQVNEAIVRIHDEQGLYGEICRIVAEEGQFELVWIGEVEERCVVPRAASGPATAYLATIRVEIDGPLGQGPTGTAVREQRPAINDDFSVNPSTAPWREAAFRHGFRASAAFPLRRRGTTVGALTIYASEPGAFDDEEVRLLGALAADVSYALDGMHHERQRLEAVEQLRQSEEARKVAEAVRAERQRLFDVLETLPALICLLTPDHHVAFANRGFRDRFGESAGRHCFECCFGRRQPCEFCETYRVLETGQPHRWELAAPDETVLDVFALPFTDADGSTMVLEMDLDITESRQAERALRDAHEHLAERAMQLRALAGELTVSEQRERRRLAGILHDHLQQLLVAAKYRVAALAQAGDNVTSLAASDVERLLDTSIAEARTLTAELSPPTLRTGSVQADLAWLARSMTDRHGLTVVLSVDEDLPPLAEDVRILLFESVRELLFNAAKHARVSSAEVTVRRAAGQKISITVSDKGAGFDTSRLTRAGEIGVGFGLFSVQERLDLLGGSMVIDSAPDRGSRFTLTVPADLRPIGYSAGLSGRQPAEPVGETASSEVPAHGRPLRVLLADDHLVVREGLRRLLAQSADIEVVGEAADGEEAIALAADLKPDVMLMDYSMPRLDGVEATRAIHRHQPDVRIIGLSMFEDDPHAEEMRDAGAVDYLTKSGPPEKLVAVIRRAARG